MDVFSAYFVSLVDKYQRRQLRDEAISDDGPSSVPLVETSSMPSTQPSDIPSPSMSSFTKIVSCSKCCKMPQFKSQHIITLAVSICLIILFAFIVTRFVGPTKLALNYWGREGLHIEGRLVCCNDKGQTCLAVPFANVAIYDRRIFTTPTLINETISDETGYFELTAVTHVFYEFRPMLSVLHDCRMTKPSTPLMQWFKTSFYDIPRAYVTQSDETTNNTVYRLFPLMLHMPAAMNHEDCFCVFWHCFPEEINEKSVNEQRQIYYSNTILLNDTSVKEKK